MTIITHGSTVTISYIGTLDNGRIFQSTEEDGPLTLTIGAGQVFPALEQELLGMKAGEVANIVLAPEQAYGPRLPENIITVSRTIFPADKELLVGQRLNIEFKGGDSRVMLITTVTDTEVTMDGNHPLAGCSLTFALRVDGITEPTA